MGGPVRRTWRRLAAAAAAMLGASWCATAGCSVGDAVCTAEDDSKLKDEGCPYGPPGGPQLLGGGCAPVILEPDVSKCTVGWDADVHPLFGATLCAGAACHGDPPGAYNVYVPANDAAQAYKSLEEYADPAGNPYISSAAPEKAWILCNLEAQPGGGSPMPPKAGLTDPATLELVRQWVRCGMPRVAPSGAGGGGTTTTTGSGGAGGAGGAGGEGGG